MRTLFLTTPNIGGWKGSHSGPGRVGVAQKAPSLPIWPISHVTKLKCDRFSLPCTRSCLWRMVCRKRNIESMEDENYPRWTSFRRGTGRRQLAATSWGLTVPKGEAFQYVPVPTCPEEYPPHVKSAHRLSLRPNAHATRRRAPLCLVSPESGPGPEVLYMNGARIMKIDT
jgi:hypothetical protein